MQRSMPGNSADESLLFTGTVPSGEAGLRGRDSPIKGQSPVSRVHKTSNVLHLTSYVLRITSNVYCPTSSVFFILNASLTIFFAVPFIDVIFQRREIFEVSASRTAKQVTGNREQAAGKRL